MFSHTYGYLIIDKGAKTMQWGKGSIFSKWYWLNWQLACRKMYIDPFFTYTLKLIEKLKEKVGNLWAQGKFPLIEYQWFVM